MDLARRALIVANDLYDDVGLHQLSSPAQDAVELGRVLGDSQIGDFEVEIVRNRSAFEVQERIEHFLTEARPDDLLVLHFSCHGLKSDDGELFLAARNTRPTLLRSTAIPARFVLSCMDTSRSRQVVLFLDCCYGGSVAKGVRVRAGGDVNVLDSFPKEKLGGGGRGRAVITASSATEYAFEGGELTEARTPAPSVFTTALVEGLASGEADRDEDGQVSLNELYDYLFDRVREQNPHQTPTRVFELQGELYLASSTCRRIRPAPLPPGLREAMSASSEFTRLGAVAALRARLHGDNLPAAAAACEALTEIADNDIQHIAESARLALNEAPMLLSETTLSFGRVPQGGTLPHRTIRVNGPPLARACAVTSSDRSIRPVLRDGDVEVSVETGQTGPVNGELTIKSALGEAVVAVHAEIIAMPPEAPPQPAEPLPKLKRRPQSGTNPSDGVKASHDTGPRVLRDVTWPFGGGRDQASRLEHQSSAPTDAPPQPGESSPQPPNHPLVILARVLVLCSIVLCWVQFVGVFTSIAALVMSRSADTRIRASGGQWRGQGRSILVQRVAIAVLALSILFTIFILNSSSSSSGGPGR